MTPTLEQHAMSQRVKQRGNRHSADTRRIACRMFEGGFNPGEIAAYLKRRGRPVDRTTVARWVDPQAKAAYEAKKRRDSATRVGRLGQPHHTPEFMLARIRAIHGLGVSCAAVASVMNFDFGSSLTESQVRYALKTGRYPKRAEPVVGVRG